MMDMGVPEFFSFPDRLAGSYDGYGCPGVFSGVLYDGYGCPGVFPGVFRCFFRNLLAGIYCVAVVVADDQIAVSGHSSREMPIEPSRYCDRVIDHDASGCPLDQAEDRIGQRVPVMSQKLPVVSRGFPDGQVSAPGLLPDCSSLGRIIKCVESSQSAVFWPERATPAP